ncbi:MAG: TetR/AcrR family transcriptional regulator [Gemmatimonadales bacterium]|nr:TetR/AcrR family transcriptional regulator [Gemmatimonadales bacterium]
MTRRRDAVSDEAVMAAVAETLGREGPGATLATIARHAGLSAPRLIQRHGGRDQLILAAFEWSAGRYLDAFARAAAAPRPFAALLGELDVGKRKVSSRDLSIGAQWIVFEWASPTLRGFNRRYLPRLRDRLAGVLRAAVRSGELPPHDCGVAAERLLVQFFGMAMYYSLTADAAGYRRELRRTLDALARGASVAPRRRPRVSRGRGNE